MRASTRVNGEVQSGMLGVSCSLHKWMAEHIGGQNQEYYIPILCLLAFDNTSFLHNFMHSRKEAETSCCLLKWRSSKKQPFMVMMSDLFQVDLTGLLWGHLSDFWSPAIEVVAAFSPSPWMS